METSMYMIKPEGMEHREKIRSLIGARLVVGERKILVLPSWAMDELYDDLTINLQRATRAAFSRGPVELGLVHGENAIDDLLAIAGDETAPADCHPASIRYRFGVKEAMVIGNARYFLNAIHRPKTQAEAEAHIALFRRL